MCRRGHKPSAIRAEFQVCLIITFLLEYYENFGGIRCLDNHTLDQLWSSVISSFLGVSLAASTICAEFRSYTSDRADVDNLLDNSCCFSCLADQLPIFSRIKSSLEKRICEVLYNSNKVLVSSRYP